MSNELPSHFDHDLEIGWEITLEDGRYNWVIVDQREIVDTGSSTDLDDAVIAAKQSYDEYAQEVAEMLDDLDNQ